MLSGRAGRRLAVAALLAGVAGCSSGDDGGVGDGGAGGRQAAVVLEQSGGCGDAFFWAATAEGDVAVTVTVEARSRSTAEPTVIDFTLPDPVVAVEVQRGRALVQPMCNDVIDSRVWRVDERLAGVSGAGRIRLAPRAEGEPSACGVSGDLRLEGLVAEDDTRVGDVAIQTDQIGCYAG